MTPKQWKEKFNAIGIVPSAWKYGSGTFANSDTVSEEYKSKVTGSMRIENGKIVEQNGAAADISPETLTVQGFFFDKNNFEDVTDEDGRFNAKVSETENFMGFAIECSNMTISVKYSQNAIESIEINHVSSNGAINTLRYNDIK